MCSPLRWSHSPGKACHGVLSRDSSGRRSGLVVASRALDASMWNRRLTPAHPHAHWDL